MNASRILIVDDERNTLKTLRRALELEGYAVNTADSVQAARAQLEGADLMLLDVQLPDGDGIELLESLSHTPNPPAVVMMSGHASVEDAVRALRLGARDFLEKPIGTERMLLTIANVLKLRQLELENATLREERAESRDELLGGSQAMQDLRQQISLVAPTEGRVLITGENGTGKELVARAIHRASARAQEVFVSLNCAAVPKDLIESELFGHEKGAFTGAIAKKIGKFERAHRGTLFLDEVGDMPPDMQAKLLRVLEAGELERVGGNRTIGVDVRVVAATNRDLEKQIREGTFREDLYYRLNVVPLVAPPLRVRKQDIPSLVTAFLDEASTRNGRRTPQLDQDALGAMLAHDYPGNVRELRNLCERIVILAPAGVSPLNKAQIQSFIPGSRRSAAPSYEAGAKLSELVQQAERMIVNEALVAHDNVVADTARALGVERSNFHKKLKALGLK